MSYHHILYDVRDAVAVITLNRPERLNAFTRQMRLDIFAALDAVRSDPAVRCLMFTGAGRGFCAGADLGDADDRANSENVDMGLSLEQEYNPLILALRDFTVPIVAAVNGPCAGAGMSLALAADIIIAARSASFLQAFCNIGLVPDAGSSWFLPRQIGRARAAGMALLGERIPAATAADWGLIWACVDDEDLHDAALAIAGKLANGPTRGLVMIRQALAASLENDLPSQLDLERELQREAGRTADFREGVQAFLEKRPANFQGR